MIVTSSYSTLAASACRSCEWTPGGRLGDTLTGGLIDQSLGLDLRGRHVSFGVVDPRRFAMALKIAQSPSLNWGGALGRTAGDLRRAVEQLESLSELIDRFTAASPVVAGAPGWIDDGKAVLVNGRS